MLWIGYAVQLIIIEMSRGLLSAISAATVISGTAFYLLWRSITGKQPTLIDRLTIRDLVIKLRKRVYSTLREISFIVNNIRTLEGDLQARKISEVFMRDGGSGEKKLEAIEALVLQEMGISRGQFQKSCEYYIRHDIEIRILLQNFRKDLDLALEGVIETYNGPLPRLSPEKVLKMQEQIIKRRMQVIYKRFTENLSNQQCLRLQFQIEDYLLLEGVSHQREANQKIFLSVLEHYYRHDAEFKERFEQLELEMEMFIIDIENRGKKGRGEEKMEREREREREKSQGSAKSQEM